MEPTLTLRGITAGYGARAVLHGLSLSLPPRSVNVVLGPNGGGKTTLLRVLSGALLPSSGELVLEGRNARELTLAERARRIALAPQTFPPTLPLTVEEAVGIARYPWGGRSDESRAAVARALDALGIVLLRERDCSELSGGELRKVLVAQALAQLGDGGVLLLDEPAAFLDPPAQSALLRLLRSVVEQRGLTLLIVQHDLALARAVADQALLLKDGALLAAGHPDEVMTADTLAGLYGCLPDELLHAEMRI